MLTPDATPAATVDELTQENADLLLENDLLRAKLAKAHKDLAEATNWHQHLQRCIDATKADLRKAIQDGQFEQGNPLAVELMQISTMRGRLRVLEQLRDTAWQGHVAKAMRHISAKHLGISPEAIRQALPTDTEHSADAI